ncbi:tRNA (adenosine(37)-N6)-threonylcarbamoyltransferase complex ATPase subunit type 1 TsaE [Aquihabitans sp. G128]|uniref:tRNA (adenosine(37)-N6)-threonylcarbamoyltransferase complex ATPase subunit type 1 TsaE n=1 Tax=Aquihabitans sp. G128 TaxID=2849779 RepID=UPI001C23F22F|nr:tRNA (adenosine(37)-N6)-threonylcarbamoyltransferase complex ATPase subunit type 1 TsaE [Aquihabitans sp. G128]QXC60352.1 tRNA (adenosine(37)-N6)-threonylcarbamoyltransferase complex ATPase subunit type 1 TsaE [Aquihabitans sp. G128]
MRPQAQVARTASAAQTQTLAAALAGLCGPGDLIVLAGDMGAGKTAFAQGFALGLGIADRVTSPTFTIVREYAGGRLALHHLDVYRLDQLREVLELGVSEMLDEEAVMLVEWGDAVLPALGDQYLEIRISFGEGDDDRRLEISPRGRLWAARERVLGEALASWTEPEPGDPSC